MYEPDDGEKTYCDMCEKKYKDYLYRYEKMMKRS